MKKKLLQIFGIVIVTVLAIFSFLTISMSATTVVIKSKGALVFDYTEEGKTRVYCNNALDIVCRLVIYPPEN